MKKILLLVVIPWVAAFWGFGAALHVGQPNGGGELCIGQPYAVTWTATAVTQKIKLVLMKGGARLGSIAENLDAGSSPFAWTIGQYIGGTAQPGTNYQVRVRTMDNAVDDLSDAFFTLKTCPNGPTISFVSGTFSMNPASPKAGDKITFSHRITVANAAVDNLKIEMGIDGQRKSGAVYVHVDPGLVLTLSFDWYSVVGNHKVYFQIDPDHTSNDQTPGDNRFEHTFSALDAGTMLQWQAGSFTMTPAAPTFGDAIMFKNYYSVQGTPVDNLKVVARLDGAKIGEKVFTHLEPQANHTFAAAWTALSSGSHTLTLTLDPDGTTDDQDPADNTFQQAFSVTPPPQGSAPNLKFGKFSVKPEKLKYVVGDKVQISCPVVNAGNQASPSAQVTVSKDGVVFINFAGTGILQPGQVFNAHFDYTVQCKTLTFRIDPTNKIVESNENDNTFSGAPCGNLPSLNNL